MTREEIKNIPEVVDCLLDRFVLADSRAKLRKRLEEVCDMAIEALEPQPKKEISYTPEEVQSILIEEGQTHGRKYGFKLGDTIKFSPVEVGKILKPESEAIKNELR